VRNHAKTIENNDSPHSLVTEAKPTPSPLKKKVSPTATTTLPHSTAVAVVISLKHFFLL